MSCVGFNCFVLQDMIYRLMYRGAAYADSLQYHHCIGGGSIVLDFLQCSTRMLVKYNKVHIVIFCRPVEVCFGTENRKGHNTLL